MILEVARALTAACVSGCRQRQLVRRLSSICVWMKWTIAWRSTMSATSMSIWSSRLTWIGSPGHSTWTLSSCTTHLRAAATVTLLGWAWAHLRTRPARNAAPWAWDPSIECSRLRPIAPASV